MVVNVETVHNVSIIHVEGDIFAEDASVLKDNLDKMFHTNRIKIVLNLEKTDVISSVGLGVILSSLIKFRKYSGDICLANVRDFVRKILKTTKVDNIIQSFPNVQSAVESLMK